MSGDVQPRKRKDKRRKRDAFDRKSEGELTFARQSSVQEDDESSHGVHITKMGSDDVHLHVHQDHGTGGHWCAKIFFFALLAVLLGLISLIILENRGLSDLDTPVSESRFSNYFDGWVDEKADSHEDHVQASIEEHEEHDEPFEEDEEPLSEADEEDATAENDDEEDEEDEQQTHEADEDDNEADDEDENEADEANSNAAAENEDNDDADEDENDDDNEADDDEAYATQETENTIEENDDEDDGDDAGTQETAENLDTVEQQDDGNDDENDNDDDDDENDTAANDDDDEADEDNENTQSAAATVEKNSENNNEDDPFDEDDDDDDDDDTFEIFDKVVDNDAEELLLLQAKVAEQQASQNPKPTSEEAIDADEAAEDQPSWFSSNDIPKEALMKRRLTIAGPEDTFPEDVDAPILPKDEEYEEQIGIEFVEEEYEDEEYDEEIIDEEDEIEVDEDGIEIERSGKYQPESFEDLNAMYRAREIKERSPHPMTRTTPPPLVVHGAESAKITPPKEINNLRVPVSRAYNQQQQQKPPPIFIAPPPPPDIKKPLTPMPTSSFKAFDSPPFTKKQEQPQTSASTIKRTEPPIATPTPKTASAAELQRRNITHDLSKDDDVEEVPYDSEEYSDDEDYDDEDGDASDIDEVSDVDDAELLQRLEAKYGKLPETAGEFESDEDPDDATWTQINPKPATDSGGAQDFDEADDSFEAQLNRAKAELERENFAAAYIAYSKLSQAYADQSQAFYGKCKSLYELNKRDESKIHANAVLYSCKRYLAFDELISNDEEYREIAEIALEIIEELGFLIQAPNILADLMARYPEDLELLRKAALTQIKLQSYNKAVDFVNQIFIKSPLDGFALAHYGLILKLRDNDYKQAAKFMRQGLDTKANGTQNAFLYLQLGEAYQRLRINKEAQKLYEQAMKLKLIKSPIQRPIQYVPDLTAKPFWSVEETEYKFHLRKIQENWQLIREEGLKALHKKSNRERELYQNETENLQAKGNWQMFELFQRGSRIDNHCKETPKTCALIEAFPAARRCQQGQIKFSVLQPNTHIWPHCGPTNARLRAHLGLIVPASGAQIRVGYENRTWFEGEFLIFDDSFEHEVWHEGESLRLVLIIDMWHPDLTEEQRRNLPAV